MLRPLGSWLIGVSLMVSPLVAAAQEPTHTYPECNREPTEGDTAAAKGAFQAGQASFNEADYQRAITYWEDAYRRDCTAHALLLNLARAYELFGQKHQAVLALETYLARKADSPQRGQIERRIEVLNAQIAREPAQAPSPAPSTPPPPTTPATPVETPAPEESGRRPIAPLIVAGAGGAIAIVGGILYVTAKSALSDAQDKCPGGVCPNQALADDGESANTRVNIGTGVAIGGLAVAAGGLVWYFVSKPSETKAAALRAPRRALPQVVPAVGHNFTGLAVTGRF